MIRLTLRVGVLCFALLPVSIAGQVPVTRHAGNDSVTVAAGSRYQAGVLKRLFLGHTYRELWATPIQVPVLDLRRFAGGLTATKTGGGNQTKSLRFVARDGSEYSFRLVDKDNVAAMHGAAGTVIETISQDQVSAHHPAAAVVAAPLLAAAGLLHVTPILTVMPDDSLLGEFRKDFSGKLGTIEAFPSKPDDAPGFAGAVEIIDSEDLRKLLDRDPASQIDVRAYLTARLMDALLNDWDRHAGNWKWARLQAAPHAPWVPIGRDRDKVFISYGGFLRVAGKVSPRLITFRGSYPGVRSLTWNSLEFDRRLLAGVEQPVWDSVAAVLVRKISDQVIDAAVRAMPREYQHSAPGLAAILKQRRNGFPEIARRLYLRLAAGPDLHATDAADRASVVRMQDGSVEVRIQADNEPPWFRRRFHPSETDEIRLYLHGGDDRAVVTGQVTQSIPVRIIGGNGNNALLDSSRVGGRSGRAHFYDSGRVTSVEYGPDSLFDRRPWIRSDGGMTAPGPDRGGKLRPLIGLRIPGDRGLVVRVGMQQFRYGFRVSPYSGHNLLSAEYASGLNAWRLTGWVDRRREGTRLHFTAGARMSELEVVNFHGLGNTTAGGASNSFRVRQRQWLLQPAAALAVGTRGDLSFGPVLQYSTTDSAANTFVSTSRPYGSGSFGQAGLHLGFRYDARDHGNVHGTGFLLDLSAAGYPAVWDVDGAFASLSASAAAHYRIPVPLHPTLVLRANGKQVFGELPFHESAFIGGSGSVRLLELQRYAGDASLSGTTELRFPLGRIPLVLPLDLGIYGFADAGRVYLDGASPGGWHSGTGLGFWVGILNPTMALTVELGSQEGRTRARIKTGLEF
jgi:hypothetical protein